MNLNQLLFKLSNITEEYAYSSLAIAYSNKLSIYKYMNILRHVNDNYSATVLSICDCLLRNENEKAQKLIDYYAQNWGLINE